MKIKLMSLVFVAVLLACSCSGIIVVMQAEVVSGATSGSAQAAPHFAQLNPDFVKYQQGLSAGNILTGAQAGTGYIPPPIDLTQLKGQSIRSALVGAAPLPSSYDLRTTGKLTSVKNMGSCGACWAFGAYASLESYLRPAETMDFSENNLKNNHGFDIAPCQGGNEFMATAYLARWSGPVSEAADPYSDSSRSSSSNLPVQKHVQDVNFLPNRANSLDNDNIKTAVAAYGAVYTTLYIVPSYPAEFNSATNAYYYKPTIQANHGVAIVGWNDSFSRTKFAAGSQPPADGAFIVKNSWGTGWGEQGYFYVSYYDPNIGNDNAVFTAQPTTNYNKIYQYDPLGNTGAFGDGSSAWGANVFTATAAENLTAVSFYTLSLNAPYEVYVYTDPVAGPINESGYAAHVAGTTAFPGYHTIPLASSIALRAGQKFSVVVKFTSTDDTPVPTEVPIDGYSSQARANAGESYYHGGDSSWSTSSTWDDMTSYRGSENTNICIKAFTVNSGATVTKPTQLSLEPSTTTPTVGQSVTFTATLKGTTALSGKSVTIYHYLNNVRYDDFTGTTNAYGQLTLTQTFSSAGQRPYYATFAGDSGYATSTSNAVSINVASSSSQTTTTLKASTTTPTVGQSVTFTATLNGGSALSGKSVTIYHYLNNVRYNDITTTTNANGQITLTQTFGSAGQRPYYATFAGDTGYKASTSSVVTINVGASSQTTTTTLKASTTTPAINERVTFTATLNGGSALSGKSVTIYHYLNNVRYNDITTTTNANGQITLTQTFGSAGQRPYYATFAGDSAYTSSTSSVVNINVASSSSQTTTTELKASTTTPAINERVTFTATLNGGSALSGKSVTIYHYLNNVRYNDITTTTNANGQITLTQTFGSAGQRPYYATFAGDTGYKASTSSAVTINVS